MSNEKVSIPTRASGSSLVYIQDIGVRMKHQTEINYLKNRIQDLSNDMAALIKMMVDAGFVEVDGKDIVVHKVKLED